MSYHPQDVEPEILELWDKLTIYQKLRERNKDKQPFYYLDGPPYTTGRIHVGHAWGKAMRDAILRYKRMQGFDVWDRPGFDMHGLPIEVKVEKQLGVKHKQEIIDKIGVQKFIETCEQYALDNLWPMVKDFKRLGVWLNWDNPYMTIKNEYIEGAWWALAKAHEKGYLYRGKKSMAWCPAGATALAKHELEYENRTDTSVYVKMKAADSDEYFLIWTTTPWTIPFNMGIMVHPTIDYVKAKLDNSEIWIVAKDLAKNVIGRTGHTYEIVGTVKGKQLEGTRYEQPYADDIPFHKEIEPKEKAAHTILLSERYVSTDQGTGLVHCAPGCGPEDYEVGQQYGLTPFNILKEDGTFPQDVQALAGKHAIKDPQAFIDPLEQKGILIATEKISHEYAHDWRYKEPIVYRSTDQWFLATEKLRDNMRDENKTVHWIPDWAGHRWFDSWLSSLQDWCISRQRFWGIPLPIWMSEDGDYFVIGTTKELEQLSGKKLENLHRPWIDEVIIEKDGKQYRRVPDVLDVWLDSGVAPWATLGYPSDPALFEKLGFPDLILEAKDQIRGWFNSLMCMSMISFEKVPYKAVYMHGHINDSLGRKMSKSLGNTISPYEVIDNYGADTLRYYTIGAANAGVDLNYNHDDAKIKRRNLTVLWNLQKFVADLAKELNASPADITPTNRLEEQYIISKLHTTTEQATQLLDSYELEKIPPLLEELFLSLSRDYIQMARDKTADDEKKTVLHTTYTVLVGTLKLFAPIAPFITEKLWQELRPYGLQEESVHLCTWPHADTKQKKPELEQAMNLAKNTIQAILHAREKAKLGIRWPVKNITVVVSKEDTPLLEKTQDIITSQVNSKTLTISTHCDDVQEQLSLDPGALGKQYGKLAPAIQKQITQEQLENIKLKKTVQFDVQGQPIALTREHLIVKRDVPPHLVHVEFPHGDVYLDTTRNDELDAEGYAREVMRRIQSLRKDAGLQKTDRITLHIETSDTLKHILNTWEDRITDKCGISTIHYGKPDTYTHTSSEQVKREAFTLYLP